MTATQRASLEARYRVRTELDELEALIAQARAARRKEAER